MKEILVIIPAYNEAENIGPVLDELLQPDLSRLADVVVINDFSSDNTVEVVKSRGIKVLNNPYNMGYGSSIQLGYKYAASRHYRYVIQMDADGQHDCSNILPIYQELGKADQDGNHPDIVLGSRFVTNDQIVGDMTVSGIKKLAIRLFRKVIWLLTKKTILDPTSGLQGLSYRAYSSYAQYGNFDDRFPDSNMILQMLLSGYRIREIPAIMHNRTVGTSMHSGLKPIIYMIRMSLSLMAVWIHASYQQRKNAKK